MMHPVAPVLLADRFAGLEGELVALLRGLAEGDWERPTSAGEWRVRDVAAHLLDGALRRISIARDGYSPPPTRELGGYRDLLGYLDELNATWVTAARRISPALLVDLLEFAGRELARALESLDPVGPAPFPVAWAGEAASANWLDIGREYTERWHHQDQIRDATGHPPLDAAKWLRPVVDISVRALPHAYRAVDARDADAIVFDIEGDAGGTWSLVRAGTAWTLCAGRSADPRCTVIVDALAAARLLMHRLDGANARAAVTIRGDARLAEPFLAARAVMV